MGAQGDGGAGVVGPGAAADNVAGGVNAGGHAGLAHQPDGVLAAGDVGGGKGQPIHPIGGFPELAQFVQGAVETRGVDGERGHRFRSVSRDGAGLPVMVMFVAVARRSGFIGDSRARVTGCLGFPAATPVRGRGLRPGGGLRALGGLLLAPGCGRHALGYGRRAPG